MKIIIEYDNGEKYEQIVPDSESKRFFACCEILNSNPINIFTGLLFNFILQAEEELTELMKNVKKH